MNTLAAVTDHLLVQFAVGFALRAGLRVDSGRAAVDPARGRAKHGRRWTALSSKARSLRNARAGSVTAVVRYRYEVGGERYEGSRIQWAASAGYRKYTRARRILDSYRSGHAIKVHYDPKRPGVAVLKPGHAMGLRPVLVLAPTAAMYTIFIAGTVLVGH
jgi:hypothetical protein